MISGVFSISWIPCYFVLHYMVQSNVMIRWDVNGTSFRHSREKYIFRLKFLVFSNYVSVASCLKLWTRKFKFVDLTTHAELQKLYRALSSVSFSSVFYLSVTWAYSTNCAHYIQERWLTTSKNKPRTSQCESNCSCHFMLIGNLRHP